MVAGYVCMAFSLLCFLTFIVLLLGMLYILKQKGSYRIRIWFFSYYSDFRLLIDKEPDASRRQRYRNNVRWQVIALIALLWGNLVLGLACFVVFQ